MLTCEYPVFLLSSPYHLPASFRFLSRNHLVTTSLPFQYHFVATQLPSNTFPVSTPLHATLFTFQFSLFTSKICISANFIVPLQPNPTLEGNMSCEKRFAKGLSLGRFLTYLNSVYCALRLINRKLRNFSQSFSNQSNSKCLWV